MFALSESFWQFIAGAPIAFVLGVIIGFALSNRYQINRRNEKGKP